MTTPAEFQTYLDASEGAHFEFKQAKSSFEFEDLVEYCVAIANEGGGKIILGVSDKKPRRVVGTAAFPEPQRTEKGLFDRLHHRIEVEEFAHPDGRVLIVHVPGRLPGTVWQYKGCRWMRSGDALVPMSDDMLRTIYAETGPDFSAEICAKATMADLDPAAIEHFRNLWQKKSPQLSLAGLAPAQLLTDAELIGAGGVTYAALILLGLREALGRLLGQAEVIFEYRSTEAPGPAQERREFRQGFLPVLDTLWELINRRNDLQHFQDGLYVWDVPTFNEAAVREGILNAVSHRDYRHGGSVFVRQYPRRIETVSPGGFPPGITATNVLWQQLPRNRRIAEVLGKCGLVERAGQGFDRMYRECIRQGKSLPDFSRTDAHFVWLTLHGEIQDPNFLRFLEKVGQERVATFTTQDFLVLDLVHREQSIPPDLRPQLAQLIEAGVVESVGRGRGTRYLLSRQFYQFIDRKGVYTRKRGLDRETNKALLLKHIVDNGPAGSPLSELRQVLPGLSESAIQRLLDELRVEKRIELRGKRRWARWFPVLAKTQN